MKKPRFSLTTMMLVVTLVAVLLGWWVDHQQMAVQLDVVRTERDLARGIVEYSFMPDQIPWKPEYDGYSWEFLEDVPFPPS